MRHRELLQFGDGRTGPLTGLVVFLPALLDLAGETEIARYYSLLDVALQGEKEPFAAAYGHVVWRCAEDDIVLCSAIEAGPNANSLNFSSNVFYYDMPQEQMADFISHEVGTHILIGDVKSLMREGTFEFGLLYRAYENLAHYLNARRVLERQTAYEMPQSYDGSTFGDLYRHLE